MDGTGGAATALAPDARTADAPDAFVTVPNQNDAGAIEDPGMAPIDAGTRSDAGAASEDAAIEPDAGNSDEPDAGPIVSDGPPAVRFVGRMDHGDPAGPKFSWSGTGLVARFMGSSVSVSLGGGQEYTVLIDGMLRPKFVPGAGTTLIAAGLAPGTHLIEMYRRTEASEGESQFLGLTFDAGGALLPPTLAPTRKIEVIGDSITCGFGNEGANKDCGFTPQTENHYMTYGAIAARAVGAEVSTIAWSGRGVVCNYGDDANSCTMPMPAFYDRALGGRGDSQWDFSAWQPQVVVINLGTNDFSTDQDPSEGTFTTAYRDFLLHIRGKYPDALILCTCGPLLWGAEHEMANGYLQSAVDALGDDNIDTFEIPPQSESDGLGCSYHPSIKTHEKMAARVVTELETRLGW